MNEREYLAARTKLRVLRTNVSQALIIRGEETESLWDLFQGHLIESIKLGDPKNPEITEAADVLCRAIRGRLKAKHPRQQLTKSPITHRRRGVDISSDLFD